MGTQRFDLNVDIRETGKHNSRGLRKSKKIPAVIYGSLKNNMNVMIDENTVLKYNTRAFENALFNVKVGSESVVALMKQVDIHPLSRRPEHVDLLAIDMTKPIRIMLEIRFDGKPVGLAEGGLLSIVNRQIEVEVLPSQIPDAIPVDIANLGVGDSVHVSDLTLPAGLKLISGTDMTLASVTLFKEDAVAAPEAAAAAPAAGAAAPAAGKAAAAKPDAKAEAAKPDAKAKK